jgi:hypothetical protein
MKPAVFSPSSRLRSENPILVIDKDGFIGEPLSLKLSEKFSIVLVSGRGLISRKESRKINHILFAGKFPIIPENKYSCIILIDEEVSNLELLPRIIKKVKAVNADFIFAQGLSREGKYAVDEIFKLDRNAKIALFGDIFTDKLISRAENPKSTINNYIFDAQKLGKIKVLGDGLREAYPVFLHDVVGGLFDLVIKKYKEDSLFYIFPKNPPFELSLAHMIQKMNPEIAIDFVNSDCRSETIFYPPGGKYLLNDQYPLAKMIRGIDINKKVEFQRSSSSKKSKFFRKISTFILRALIFLLLAPFIFTIFFSLLGLGTFYFGERETHKGNFVNAKNSFHLSEVSYSLGKQASEIFLKQAGFVGLKNNFDKLSQDIDSRYEVSSSLFQAFNAGMYFTKVMSGKSENSAEDFARGENSLKNSLIALDKARMGGEISKSVSENLERIPALIKFLYNIVDVAPKICGMEEQRTYLILFQDNLELRPGGGLIDSYGILKFNLGKITEFSFYDVPSADQQLRGHVEPPFAIRRYLLEKHWLMKDSNFDVDFIQSALSASNFLLTETGQKFDGVIAMDTAFTKEVLRVIGQVNLTDYKKAINEDNFYTLMQSYGQENNFLKSLNEAIIKKITNDRVNYFLMAQVISDSLEQKHLLLNFKDEQNIFTVNGWSSSLWDEREKGKEFVNDFLGINEANLGLNKVNYFVSRQLFQKVAIGRDGVISEELTINYENKNTIKKMDYKNYLRIILPEGAILSEVLINDSPQAILSAVIDPLIFEKKDFKPPQGLEVEKLNEGGKDIVGFLVVIPTGENVKVTLKYSLAKNVLALGGYSYNLKLFKQPGIDSFPYSLSLVYPDSFRIIKNSDGVIKSGGLVYFGEIKKDKNITVNLAEE